jgi:hypothetical protein
MSGRENRAGTASALEQLEELRAPLMSDMPIAALERYEESWKHALSELLTSPLSGNQARMIAAFQRDVGLLPKYKSYAVKASSPLGYSVFFQEPRKGFSFQQHLHHKVEIFHVLETGPEAFALLCTLAEWSAVYDREAFSRWLDGAADDRFEKWKIPLVAGDVLCLESTGIVHTVIGCTLEEFATASTDMVDRLHDQNEGEPIPVSYRRDRVQELLRTTPYPAASQAVTGTGGTSGTGRQRSPIPRSAFPGGEVVTLGAVPGLRAARIHLESGRRSPLQSSRDESQVLFVSRGDVSLLLGTPEELAHQDPAALELPRGAAAMIPPAMSYALASLNGEAEVSVHSIRPEVALP